MADLSRRRRRRWLTAIGAAVLCLGVLVVAVWTDADARARSRSEQAALARARTHLATVQHDVAITRFAKAVTTNKRNALQTSINSTMSQLAVTNGSLANTNVHAYVQGVGIDTLQTCLGGVKSAFGQIAANHNTQAAQAISAVSGAVHPAGRRHGHRPGLPVRLPRPLRDSRRPDLLRLCHQFGGGQHPDHRLDGPHALDGDRQRVAEPPRMGGPRQHLGPCRGHDRRRLRPLLRGGRGGRYAGVHLGGDRQPTAGAVQRHVDGTAGVPAVTRGLHRPRSIHRHQRNAVPRVEVRRPGLVGDLVGATHPVGHGIRRRGQPQPHCSCRTRRGSPGPSRPPNS